jgi:hypothetical protein
MTAVDNSPSTTMDSGPSFVDGRENIGSLEVVGTVTTNDGIALPELRVELWDINLDGGKQLASGVTDARGGFAIAYDAHQLIGKPRADLSVRVVDPRTPNAELARSATLYQADPQVTVNLVVPAGSVAQPSEYARLRAAVQPVLGTTALAALDAKGVEYVANRVRWDARSVAMAAQAARLAASTTMPAEHYYALMRAGVAGDADALHRLPSASVKRAVELAMSGGVISGEHPIDATLALQQRQSAAALQRFAPASAVSDLGTMLGLSLDAARTATFLEVYHATADRPAELWTTLAQRGFDAATIARLQTDGKLGMLTRQNAPLIGRLRTMAKIATVEDLAGAGLYRAAAWKPLIGTDVPTGATVDTYAESLAAQVNLSYPTLVVAAMVRSGELAIDVRRDGAGEVAALARNGEPPIDVPRAGGEGEVATFLRNGHGTYTIGIDPVKQWTGYDKLTPQGRDGARLAERLYQLSPSNDAMVALHRRGLHSAFQITQQPRERFLAQHGGAFPSPTEAELVYLKAQEISTTTLHVATTYLTSRSAPNVYAMTGKIAKQPPPGPKPPGGPGPPPTSVPTLESLLQNMDYCACDECKSVLGAAAYFVDLLQLINIPPPQVASNPDPKAPAPPPPPPNPLDVLLGRRPDLGALLLSCENTNVALPYIDLVNEVLEYYIVHGNLTGFVGHNMREDSNTADLLADPEYVLDAAYAMTRAEVFPHGLPFDMPLAALRLLMKGWGTTLADALSRFGTAAAARREVLGFNAAEISILTNIGFRKLPEYFGEPADATIDALNNAIAAGKEFSRRADISYEELVALLRTRFINPGAPLVPLLTPLGVSLAQLQSWYTGAISDAAMTALFPPNLVAADYLGGPLQWLRDHRALIMGLITLTDVDPDAMDCDFATVELRYALPDNTANRLTELAYHKLNRFIRLWRQLGWSIELTDQVVIALLGIAPEALTIANVDATFSALLTRLANLLVLQRRQSITRAQIPDWLAIWDTGQTVAVRQEQLARLLRIATTDLVHFSELTGIDPLAADMADDTPSLLRFLDAWAALATTRLKVVDLDYLLRHRDSSGALTPSEDSLRRDLKALRDGLTAVDASLAAPPENADLGYARGKLALVYDPAVVDRFLGLLGGGITYRAPLPIAADDLPTAIAAADPRVAFDPFGKQLVYSGILSAAAAAALGVAAGKLKPGDDPAFPTQADLDGFVKSFQGAVQKLVDAGQADLAALGAAYPELKLVYDAVAPIADPAAQARALVEQVLPALRDRLQRLAVATSLATLLRLDAALVDALLAGPAVVHAAGDPAAGAIQDFVRLDEPVALTSNAKLPLYVDPPSTDEYILYVAAPEGAAVTLIVDGTTVIQSTVGKQGEVETAVPLAFRAGALVPMLLMVSAPPAGRVELRWRTKGMAKTAIPASRLYAAARLQDARASLLQMQKAALLLRAIPLTARELKHLAATNPDTAGLLSALDVDASIADAALHAQWTRLAWLAWFSQLKADEPDADTWVSLLEAPGQTSQGKSVLAAVAGWTEQDLAAVVGHFGLALAAPLPLHVLRKVRDAVDFVVATGQTAADLIAWSVETPDAALIVTIKAALRAHQPPESWRATLQDVNDALRNQRRDALVSCILHHLPPAPNIGTADKLYEQFLIDVEMDACMQTSRIRQALSTVQLFIARCLMNLEPAVSPSLIDTTQWTWMKRYRVWQANREVFLYPENWLEPELRDNKSPLFAELEAELLKSDITDDLAEEAYLNYLKKLDDIARLEIVGTYLEEHPAKHTGEIDDNVLHVFGRTKGKTRQHYYRRYEHGYWTPWDKMALNIEGDLLVPVIWKSQLFAFWLTSVPKPQGAAPSASNLKWGDLSNQKWSDSAKLTVELTLSWAEYYQGKWTSPKSLELKQPMRLTDLDQFEPEKLKMLRSTAQPSPDVTERLLISVSYEGSPPHTFRLVLTSKNAAPTSHDDDVGFFGELDTIHVFTYDLLWAPQPKAVTENNAMIDPGKTFTVRILQPSFTSHLSIDEVLLTKTPKLGTGFRVLPLMHPTENRWEAPMHYADERSTFFIIPDEHIDLVAHYAGYFYNDVPAITVAPNIIQIPSVQSQPVASLRGQTISNGRTFIYDGVRFAANGAATSTMTREIGR